MSIGSSLTRDIGDSELVNAMMAHMLVCDECAKVAMMVARACVAGAFAEPTSTSPPVLRLVRHSRALRSHTRARQRAPGRQPSPADAA